MLHKLGCTRLTWLFKLNCWWICTWILHRGSILQWVRFVTMFACITWLFHWWKVSASFTVVDDRWYLPFRCSKVKILLVALLQIICTLALLLRKRASSACKRGIKLNPQQNANFIQNLTADQQAVWQEKSCMPAMPSTMSTAAPMPEHCADVISRCLWMISATIEVPCLV